MATELTHEEKLAVIQSANGLYQAAMDARVDRLNTLKAPFLQRLKAFEENTNKVLGIISSELNELKTEYEQACDRIEKSTQAEMAAIKKGVDDLTAQLAVTSTEPPRPVDG